MNIQQFVLKLRSSNEAAVLRTFRAVSSHWNISSYRDESGCSLLHLAALYAQGPLTTTLALQYPELINEQDDDDQTPLHLAMMISRNDIAYTLLRAGTNTLLRDVYRETVCAKCSETPINYLMLTVFKATEEQHDAPIVEHVDRFNPDLHKAYNLAYLEHRAPSPLFNEYSKELHQYPLHRAMFRLEWYLCTNNLQAAAAYLPTLRALLLNGPVAEVSVFLQRIIRFYSQRSILVLLEHGPVWYPCIQQDLVSKGYVNAYMALTRQLPLDINEPGRYGNTVLHEACFHAGRHPICIKLCKKLIRRGADLSIRNDAGRTALEVAPAHIRRMLYRLVQNMHSTHRG